MKPVAVPVVALLLLAAAAGAAHAQPGATPLVQPMPPPPPPQVDSADDKSPAAALSLSLLGTVGSWGLVFAVADMEESGEALGVVGLTGIVVGPSFGQFYAGEWRSGWRQAGVRALAVGGLFVGALWTVSDCFWEEGDCDSPGVPVMIGSAAVGVAATIYSIVDAPFAAERANKKRRQVIITPAPMLGPQRTTGYGMVLSKNF